MGDSLRDERGVFRNKLGITDPVELKAVEYSLTSRRFLELDAGRVTLPLQGFGLARLQAIHGHLFQDLYAWAGQLRETPSSKRAENGLVSVFENPDRIVSSWEKLAESTSAFADAKTLPLAHQRASLTGLYIEANRIHPFPEGNGRSLQLFMKQLAREQALELDFTRTSPRAWNLASAVSGTHGHLVDGKYLIPERANPELFTEVLEQVVRPARAVAFDKLPEAEAIARFPELRAAYSGLRAIEEQVRHSEGANSHQVAVYMTSVREAFVKRLDENTPIERHRQIDRDR